MFCIFSIFVKTTVVLTWGFALSLSLKNKRKEAIFPECFGECSRKLSKTNPKESPPGSFLLFLNLTQLCKEFVLNLLFVLFQITLLCSAQNATAVIFLLKLEINSLKLLDTLGMIPASFVLQVLFQILGHFFILINCEVTSQDLKAGMTNICLRMQKA